jgi:hypothetical protein
MRKQHHAGDKTAALRRQSLVFHLPWYGQMRREAASALGGRYFRFAEAYRLGYRSQRETPRDRSLTRAFALREKIGGEGGIGDYIPKPKGMHRRTFERVMERIYRAEEIVEWHSDLLLDRLNRLASR